MSQPLARIVVISPFDQPDADVAMAAGRAGATGILDLGRNASAAKAALARIAGEAEESLGIRVPPGVTWSAASLPRSSAPKR